MRIDTDVAIIGSGFAGSLLARGLAEAGRRVVMVDRAQHPRFALGESTTPLGNLALERLARRYGWRDVWNLANWGRLKEHHPSLRCGLKRGFTFLPTGKPGSGSPVMVAASPSDQLADTQWYRSHIDAHLASVAEGAGARHFQRTRIDTVDVLPDRVRLTATSQEHGALDIEADFVVDGSGSNGVLANALDLPRADALPFQSSLLFAHFVGLDWFDDGCTPAPAAGGQAPYPPQWSAVHHLLDLGWMYELRFDDPPSQGPDQQPGLASCGWVLDHARCEQLGVTLPGSGDGAAALHLQRQLCERYPQLGGRFANASLCSPLRFAGPMQWRLQCGRGARFALLPQAYAFYDPMFSVGIAWSLLAVERLLDGFLSSHGASRQVPSESLMRHYDRLLAQEADHIERLLAGAYAVLDDVDQLGWYSQVYFAAASYAETQQRMLNPDEGDVAPARRSGWHWRGFLGADDPVSADMVSRAAELAMAGRATLGGREHGGAATAGASTEPDLTERLADAIPGLVAPRNVAGLADPRVHPRYSVDPETVVAASELLGLTPAVVRERLPRLLGASWD